MDPLSLLPSGCRPSAGQSSLARIARFGDSKIEPGVATRAHDYTSPSSERHVASDYHLTRPHVSADSTLTGVR